MGAYLCQDALANNFRDNLCASHKENHKGCLTQHKTQLTCQAVLWCSASYSQKQWNPTRYSGKKKKKKRLISIVPLHKWVEDHSFPISQAASKNLLILRCSSYKRVFKHDCAITSETKSYIK